MPSSSPFSTEQLAQYERDGFLLVRGLFRPAEVDRLLQFGRADSRLAAETYGRKDATGLETRLALWNDVGDDLYSMFSRSERIVRRAEQLLEEEVYHYHSKLNMKEPRVGGAWEWHQDYGYWYNFGCLFPRLVSCMTAVTDSTRENGCLMVMPGSHHLGRIDHGKTGEQTGADMERVEQALLQMEQVAVGMQPGDSLFFHCNLLHRSDANLSELPRWTLISCYNARQNSPYKAGRHPQYTPLVAVDDQAILNWSPAPVTSPE